MASPFAFHVSPVVLMTLAALYMGGRDQDGSFSTAKLENMFQHGISLSGDAGSSLSSLGGSFGGMGDRISGIISHLDEQNLSSFGPALAGMLARSSGGGMGAGALQDMLQSATGSTSDPVMDSYRIPIIDGPEPTDADMASPKRSVFVF